MSTSVIILAGGRSERLGRDKATLVLNGQTLLQRQIDLLQALSGDLIVARRPDQVLELQRARPVTDLEPFAGVLAGLAAGLLTARNEWSLVVACDMPFLNRDLLMYMLTLRQGHDIVVPRQKVGLEPLHALYHKRCLAPLCRALAAGQRRVVSFYQELCVCYVSPADLARFDPLGRSFFNINTMEDLAQAQHWMQEGGNPCT